MYTKPIIDTKVCIIPAVIGAAGALGAAAASFFGNKSQAEQNREFQERMYNKQVEDNINFWKMQNEYNLPSAQVARLKDANLNPYLAYGQGGNIQNVAQSAPQSASAPQGSQAEFSFQNPFQNLAQNMLVKAQIENIKSDSELKTAQALTEAERTIKEREDSDRIRSEAEFNWRSMRDRLLSIHQHNQLERMQTALNDELAKTEPENRKKIIEEQRALVKQRELIDRQIDDIDNQIRNRDIITEAQRKKLENDVNLACKRFSHEIALMDAEARKLRADAFVMEIEGAIKDLPEWQISYLNEMIGRGKQALYQGHEEEINAFFQKYLWDNMPRYDSSSYDYRKWLKNYVVPTTQAFGYILGGSGAAAISLLKD